MINNSSFLNFTYRAEPVVLSAKRVNGACFAADTSSAAIIWSLKTFRRQEQVVVEAVQQHRTLVQRTTQTRTRTAGRSLVHH